MTGIIFDSWRTSRNFSLLSVALFLWSGLLPQQVLSQTNPPPAKSNNLLVMIQGSVEVTRSRKSAWGPGQLNQILFPGDRVRTGERSRAEVYLSNGMTIQKSELSELEIPPSPGVTFKNGVFHILNRDRNKDSQFKLPGATAAIRGTDFLVSVKGGTAELTVLDGMVQLSNDAGEVLLANNERGTVENGGAPRKTVVLEAVNHLIQWFLYYPGILHVDDMEFTADERAALASSLKAYRMGDLLQAEKDYPWQTPVSSEAGRAYRASLLLNVGQVEKATALIQKSSSPSSRAMNKLIAAVKFETSSETNLPASPAEWLAESYYRQSLSQLTEALNAARAATANAPDFGFAWGRLAELEFSFGHTEKALTALEKSLTLSPRNAQAIALKGFLLAAQNKIPSALSQFDAAIAADSALGNAWLGRGLCLINRGRTEEGLRDLHVAASLEPQRSVLRSYLGKAFAETDDQRHAERELALAKKLDPNDPTSWLYSALLNQQQHRFNEGIRDLEKSLELNDNRRVYRSQLLLDQDRAVRSSSLAAIYRDNGMTDVSVREASRAVTDDYGNYSAHLFLANSFDQLRDRTGFNLRYETVWFNELLLANLLSPVGAGTFSQNISQQEYSRLFDVKKFGLATTTTVRSDGQYHEEVSQFGTFDKFGYALDLDYQHNDGVRPNNELDLIHWFSTFKFQLTPQDTIFLETEYRDFHSGDNFQYYNWHHNVKTNFTFDEFQTPNLLIGYHREWSPGAHTLLLAGRLANDQRFGQTGASELLLFTLSNKVTSVAGFPFDVNYRSQPEIYTAELNQIFQNDWHTLVFGGRYQNGEFKTRDRFTPESFGDFFSSTSTNSTDDFERVAAYAYYTVEPVQNLFLTAGMSYDQVTFPTNFRGPPTSAGESNKELFGPKAAIVYSPADWITLRGIYTRSLGGVSLEEDYRLEPTQLAGFVQTFRTVIPESVVGSVSAPELETFGAAVDLKFKTGTYIGLRAELLSSEVNREIGAFDFPNVTPPILPSSTREQLEFEERSASIVVNQLLADEWSAGVSYKFTSSELHDHLENIPTFLLNGANNTATSDLHQLGAYLLFNHPCGFFARGEVNCFFQDNSVETFTGTTSSTLARKNVNLPSEDFPQFNAYIGWRFPRQLGDVTFGVLNIGDGDYHLNPLNSQAELARERVFTAQLRLRF